MSAIFVLGNGTSRQCIDLDRLKSKGRIFGCNALYRTFVPDVLISTDPGISTAIQESGYSSKHLHYTRRPIEGLGAKKLPRESYGWSSGPNAAHLACIEKPQRIYLLGFDLGGTTNGKFNNIYSDSEFYKKSSDSPTYSGNWIKQLAGLFKKFPDITFYHIVGESTAKVDQFKSCTNLRTVPIAEFIEWLNKGKDL